MKPHILYILNHATWSVGNGKQISFWSDKWLDHSIADHWNIPSHLLPDMELAVEHFIVNGRWCLPPYIHQKDPELAAKISKITLHKDDIPDTLPWNLSPDGCLTQKIAFSCLFGNGQQVNWAKFLWNSFIPPTRSFITWRILFDKLPTDDNLRKRGCCIVSICCFCRRHAETSSHIFFECAVTAILRSWLSKGTDIPLDLTSCNNLILNSMGRGSTLVQQILNSAIIHTIWAIWIERNQRCFHNKHQSMATLFNCILAEVKLGYKLILAKGNFDMQDYKISRLFNIPFKTKRATAKHDVHWCPPPTDVIKFNYDGSSIGAHPCGAIGIVIRRSSSSFLGAISSNIGNATTLEAEFSACMLAIEKAREMHFKAICLESDSIRVVHAYNKNVGVPWKMKARWYNCMKFCHNIICSCHHEL